MSEPDEIMLWCWVLGDPPNRAFTVSIKLSAPIHHLKIAIHAQKPSFKDIAPAALEVYKFNLCLETFNEDAQGVKLEDGQQLMMWNDISLYWVKDPGRVMSVILPRPYGTSITPSSSYDSNLLQQVKSNISTHASSTGERPPAVASSTASHKCNLNDIGSNEERGKRHKVDSSIVDDGPCYANFGFDRLHYDNTPRDLVLHFYEQFWGIPLPQEHISLKDSIYDPNDEENDENGEENGSDVLPATPPPIIDTNWMQLLIRAEYLRIYKWVEDMYAVGKVYRPSAIVVTGQPGIGKSFWAYYVLRRRLGEKSVSLWCQASMFYLFCSEGVLIVPATFSFNKFSPPVWTIIDSAQSPSGIPSTLTHFPPGVFPIYITSPQPDRWSGITQSWTFHQVIMNPWTRVEIEYATNIVYLNQGLDDALQRYDSLGPTARFCFELSPDEVARHISERDNAINRISPDLLKQLFLSSSGLSLDNFSHKICLIRRKRGSALGDGRVTADLISVAVEQQVVQRLEVFSNDQLLDMWTNFSKFGDARGMTGSIFEVFVHRCFRKRIYLDARPMVRSNRANSRWHASFGTKRPPSATIHGVAQQVFSLQVDVGSTFVYDTTTKLNIRPDVYYIHRSGQQVALDSFILHGGYLNIFQCTGCHDHDIKSGINDFLASCSGLPPRTNWRFVFVIPDDLVSFSCPATSDSVAKDLGLYTARIPMSRLD
ncbi:hypothetical protein APHAL10511_006863 [Amanita phalloides]|nr:hypothetical protein APHAL10511_006863 [Amanita phalloides]